MKEWNPDICPDSCFVMELKLETAYWSCYTVEKSEDSGREA